MQRATEGKSIEVNLDVAHGNIALAAEIATAWSARTTRGHDDRWRAAPRAEEAQP
jgi:hypothetical protein